MCACSRFCLSWICLSPFYFLHFSQHIFIIMSVSVCVCVSISVSASPSPSLPVLSSRPNENLQLSLLSAFSAGTENVYYVIMPDFSARSCRERVYPRNSWPGLSCLVPFCQFTAFFQQLPLPGFPYWLLTGGRIWPFAWNLFVVFVTASICRFFSFFFFSVALRSV